MKNITVTFPTDVSPETFKRLMEQGVSQFSEFEIQVLFSGTENGENDYMIASYNAEAFYFAGMTASSILHRMNQVKTQVANKTQG